MKKDYVILMIFKFLTINADVSTKLVEEETDFIIPCSLQGSVVHLSLDFNNSYIVNGFGTCSKSGNQPCKPKTVECALTEDTCFFTLTSLPTLLLRDLKFVICKSQLGVVNKYAISVFARPENVTCATPTLQNQHLSLTCSVQKIFPEASCRFFLLSNGKEIHDVGSITHSHRIYLDHVMYYEGQCSWELDTGHLTSGKYKIIVYVHPKNTRYTEFNYVIQREFILPTAISTVSTDTTPVLTRTTTEFYEHTNPNEEGLPEYAHTPAALSNSAGLFVYSQVHLLCLLAWLTLAVK
ncbi:hypothetical protein Bpfe_001236 [Biomphalaria pfeifferi]|uniref:Uncharacterized protein n=1 Tax=Biomphalaria pfeifferi TaxID=112525 RepID=A0AAD8CB51_BIOPF|nr:hypothetical protein Bpfe_001236 [Biomphalaria pfeifferi]